ncbi:uncharacterized protein LOC133714446 [Rosa rugosa]|uniref:uncharacterized protein LOC133714446 n=1 Tax=Rosa rugosa TaxID=74645 RepID=UPI002B403CAD|nr:uncharacterized protein LOC133714446 [Rosa rugosa]
MVREKVTVSTRTLQWKCVESRADSKRLYYGRFILAPLMKGQADIIGIAMRRALLREIEGTCITRARSEKIPHEYSTIVGIQESVHEILMNLKEIVLRSNLYGTCNASICVKGPGYVTTQDIILSPSVEIVDNTQHIVKTTIVNVASVAGKFQDMHMKLFDRTGKIRMTDIPEQQQPSAETGDKRIGLRSPFQNFADIFNNGVFRFMGVQTPILPSIIARDLFGRKDTMKQRKPVLIQNAQMQDATSTDQTLALIPVDEQPLEPLKRNYPPSPFSAPKKLKFMMDEFNGNTAPMKKVKIPALPFTAKSLGGLVETPSGMLVLAEVMMSRDGG